MGLVDLFTDNIITISLFGLTFIAVLLLFDRARKPRRNSPKGPTALPFFGNTLFMEENDGFLRQTLEWGKQYGPVYTLFFGSNPTVVVNGLNTVKELLVKTGLDFGDRPSSMATYFYNPKLLGIFDSRADEGWKNQRKFAHTTLRGMGFGKVSLEPLIKEEVDECINYFMNEGGKALNPQPIFAVSASNIICRLVFGRRFEQGSKSADDVASNVRILMNFADDNILSFFPSMMYVLQYTEKWKESEKALEEVMTFFEHEIREHEERMNRTAGEPEVNDFIDAYLVQEKEAPEKYTHDHLRFVLLDLFLAGTDTVSTTLTWGILYLVTHPDIQQKIHDEIIREIGQQSVSLSHRSKLPYTEAALLEVQRLATVAPIIPREATKDATLCGFDIAKGTQIFVNIWSLHHDPNVWLNPDRFHPDRFLENDGTTVKQSENFLPFSAGRRVCMGEQLAKLELFLFFTSVVQRLKFSLPVGSDVPSMVGSLNVVRQPATPFDVVISSWSD